MIAGKSRSIRFAIAGKIAVGMLLLTWLATPVLAAPPKSKASPKLPTTGATIISMTPDVKVYIDGKLAGKTPFEDPVALRSGKHKLKATKAGYSTFEQDFTVKQGKLVELTVDLIPFSGLVKFTCNVVGAEVYVDKKLIGQIPLVQEVSVGDHEVQILKEGYNDFTTTINVKGGEKHFLEASLSPFQDLSPEVLAIAKAQKEKEAADRLAAKNEATNVEQVPAAPPWYADWYKKWWVWTIAGAVVVTAVTVPLAANTGGQSGLHLHDKGIVFTFDLGKK